MDLHPRHDCVAKIIVEGLSDEYRRTSAEQDQVRLNNGGNGDKTAAVATIATAIPNVGGKHDGLKSSVKE
ncbi:hypothetical protein U1Q18_017285, partial [Sarracenia purpurea var. burkii]